MGSFVRRQVARIRGSLRRGNFEREVDQEFEDHLALLAERFMRQGMTAEEARYAARKQFGGMTQMRNELRERSRFRLFEVILQDSGYVWRQFRRAPLFAFAANFDAGVRHWGKIRPSLRWWTS